MVSPGCIQNRCVASNWFSDQFFMCLDASSSSSGILPATRARLVSLKDFGAKKIGALRLKLAESRIKQTEKGASREHTRHGICLN